MSEDVAPYSGAIEETAKTTGKAFDLIRDSARPIADAYGLIIGDRFTPRATGVSTQLREKRDRY